MVSSLSKTWLQVQARSVVQVRSLAGCCPGAFVALASAFALLHCCTLALLYSLQLAKLSSNAMFGS